MTNAERKEFADRLRALFNLYRQQLTPETIQLWWRILVKYPLSFVKEAFGMHAADPEAGMYPPCPAHIIKHLDVSIPQRLRAERTALFNDRADRIKPLTDALFMLEANVRHAAIAVEEGKAREAAIKAQVRAINDDPAYDRIGQLSAVIDGLHNVALIEAPETR